MFLKEKEPNLELMISEDVFLSKVFKNAGTLRLTYGGFKLLSRWCNNHQFNIKVGINCKHFLGMCNRFSAPYYFNDNSIWLFGRYDAFESSFNDDITDMLERYSKWEENREKD